MESATNMTEDKVSIMTMEELEICKEHLKKIKDILKLIQFDTETVRSEITAIDKKVAFWMKLLPFWWCELFLSWHFDKKRAALAKKYSGLTCQNQKLERDFDSYKSMIGKIQFGENFATPEDSIKFFSIFTKNLMSDSSIPSTIPIELWRIKNNIQKRAGIKADKENQDALTIFIESLNRPGYGGKS